MKRRFAYLCTVILFVAFLMPVAFSSTVHAQEGEVLLGVELPLSGVFGYFGKQWLIAANMAVEDINKAGGINGRKLRITVYDTGSKPDEAILGTRKLIEVDKVIAIVGPLSSSETRVAFPIANRAGVPIVSSASSAPGIGAANRPWAFRNVVLEADIADPAFQFYTKKYNIKSVSVIVDTKDVVSKTFGTDVMPPLLKKYNIALLDTVSYQSGDVDFSAHVTKLKEKNPDGIILAGVHNEAAGIAREVRRQNMKQPFFGAVPLASELYIKRGGAAVEGTVVGTGFWVDSPDPTISAWVKRFKELDPLHDAPHQTTAQKYESIMIMKYCMEKSGVTHKPENIISDREKIRDCLANLKDFPVMSSRVTINQDGDGKRPTLILMVQNGKFAKMD